MNTEPGQRVILSVDVGGSHVKALPSSGGEPFMPSEVVRVQYRKYDGRQHRDYPALRLAGALKRVGVGARPRWPAAALTLLDR